MKSRTVFFLSDRTGLTAESYGRSLLAQFPDIEFENRRLSFVDTPERAEHAVLQIEQAAVQQGSQVVVFSTLVEPHIQAIIETTTACVINLFGAFISPLEACLGEVSSHSQGMSQNVFGINGYQERLDAIDYSLAHDDGVRQDQYDEADVILVGVSRSGKTPTSLYLAMHFSLKVSNYPLTDNDFSSDELPAHLLSFRSKLVGLSIRPERLSNIRHKRRPNSEYSSLSVCRKELRIAEQMFAAARIPVYETTDISIEEIASLVIKAVKGDQGYG